MKIVHVTSYFDESGDAARRNALARQTWAIAYRQGDWVPLPVLDASLPRLFAEGNRRLPFVKDLVGEAIKTDVEYICLTNSDTCFSTSLNQVIRELLWKHLNPLIYGNRKDFPRLTRPLSDYEITNCKNRYPGLDIFLFPREWWLKRQSIYPDMLLGREAFDLVLKVAMELDGGFHVENLIYHEKHQSVWEARGNKFSLPGQLHNRSEATRWLRLLGIDPSAHGLFIREELKPQRPSTQETPPGGWRVTWCDISKTSYSIDLLIIQMKDALAKIGLQAPKDLREIIISQSLPL